MSIKEKLGLRTMVKVAIILVVFMLYFLAVLIGWIGVDVPKPPVIFLMLALAALLIFAVLPRILTIRRILKEYDKCHTAMDVIRFMRRNEEIRRFPEVHQALLHSIRSNIKGNRVIKEGDLDFMVEVLDFLEAHKLDYIFKGGVLKPEEEGGLITPTYDDIDILVLNTNSNEKVLKIIITALRGAANLSGEGKPKVLEYMYYCSDGARMYMDTHTTSEIKFQKGTTKVHVAFEAHKF